MDTQFVRSSSDKMISGVCGGLGRYFGVDSSIVRLLFLASVIFFGVSPLVYVILWIVMPMEKTAQIYGQPPIALPVQPVQPVTQPVQPVAQPVQPRVQDPTGEWKFDPYTGQPVKK